jgi:hypothetical protein
MQRETNTKFSDLTSRQKVEYIWEYYKLAIFGIIILVVIIVNIIIRIISPPPETLITVALTNANSNMTEDDVLFQEFVEQSGYDWDDTRVALNSGIFLSKEGQGQTDFANYQALVAQIMVGEIDVLGGEEHIFEKVGAGKAMYSLYDILPAEVIEKHKAKIKMIKDTETGDEIPCAILLPPDSILIKEGYYKEGAMIGVPLSSSNLELAVNAIIFLLGEKNNA